MEERPSLTAGGGVSWGRLRKLGIELARDPAAPFRVHQKKGSIYSSVHFLIGLSLFFYYSA